MNRPYFISRHHLEGIRRRSVSVSGRMERARGVEERFKSYVRDKSQQMTRNWPNSVQKLNRQQEDERERGIQQRSEADQRAYEAMREQQRMNRRAQIEEIEAKMRRAQPGPKLLDSAALLSDCLKVQQSQREELALRNISNRQEAAQEGHLLRMQNHQWNLEQEHRQQENHLRAMRYKQDLRTMMQERAMQTDVEVPLEAYPTQREVEKERKELQRRRIQMRAIATDAMRMAEQRRLREKMTEEVQEKLCTLHLEGKERQEAIRGEQQKILALQQKQRQEAGREKVARILIQSSEEEKAREAAVQANALEEYQKQLLARETAERERKKLLKAQRIQFHLEEMKEEKERKAQGEMRSKEATDTRLANVEVSRRFAREQRERRMKEAEDLRRRLAKQWDEKQATEKANKEGVQLFTNRHCDFSRDHTDFVNFAKEALQVAREKSLPVKPFVKAINAYEKDNFVEEKPLLPHLEIKKPAVYYDRDELPKNNSKEVIRYNIEQLRALNAVAVRKDKEQK